jgi:hypothetical protein
MKKKSFINMAGVYLFPCQIYINIVQIIEVFSKLNIDQHLFDMMHFLVY